MKTKQLTLKEFVGWYENEYSSGDLRARNFAEMRQYLQGLYDALPPSKDLPNLKRAIACLHGAENLVERLTYLAERGASDLELNAMRYVQTHGVSADELAGK